MRMTPSLRAALHAAVEEEPWDPDGTTAARDEAHGIVARVPDGYDFDRVSGEGQDDPDAEGPEASPGLKLWIGITYFGLDQVDGDWQWPAPRLDREDGYTLSTELHRHAETLDELRRGLATLDVHGPSFPRLTEHLRELGLVTEALREIAEEER